MTLSLDGTFRRIAGSEFILGDTGGRGFPQERPAHVVWVDDCWIAKRCTMAAEYLEFIRDCAGGFREAWCDFINPCFIVHAGSGFELRAGCGGYPMVQVSYEGAAAYCNWLSLRWGLDPVYVLADMSFDLRKNGFRLPTEAEWELACAGGSAHVGEDSNEFDAARINGRDFAGPSLDPRAAARRHGGFGLREQSPVPVGSLHPNRLGLHEMLGNVNEWCNDRYGPYSAVRQVRPSGCETGSFRVIRGGCFLDGADKCRTTYRHGIHFQAKCMVDGFRLALNA